MNTAIDSLKIRIPLNKVDVLKLDVTDYFADTNLSTGEVDIETYKRRRYTVKEKGITTSYLVQRGGNVSRQEDTLLILFSSKLLKADYLKGITKDTIKKIFNELMSQQVVSFSYESFMEGRGTDIDIKIDNILEGESPLDLQMDLVKELAKSTKVSSQKRKGYDMNKSSTNLGIAWSKREVATIGSPYLKLYAKDIELTHKSHLFMNTYLGGEVQEGLTRIEGTIKNQKHFDSLIGDKVELNLANLLSLSEAQMNNTIKAMASKHIEQQGISQGERGNEWGLTEAFCLGFLIEGEIKSMGLAKSKIGKYTGDKQQTYRARKKIEQVWSTEIAETEQGQRGEQLDKVFSSLGIGED